jgi:hypothetical protein
MIKLVQAITSPSVGHILVDGLLAVATLTATLMIAVGMAEELPGIIRDVWNRSFSRR